LASAFRQPAPSQRSQVPALVNPAAEQAGHSFQSAFRISRPFVPAHRFSPIILPHSLLISAALYDGAAQWVHLATGVGLWLMRSPQTGPVVATLRPLSGYATGCEATRRLPMIRSTDSFAGASATESAVFRAYPAGQDLSSPDLSGGAASAGSFPKRVMILSGSLSLGRTTLYGHPSEPGPQHG